MSQSIKVYSKSHKKAKYGYEGSFTAYGCEDGLPDDPQHLEIIAKHFDCGKYVLFTGEFYAQEYTRTK